MLANHRKMFVQQFTVCVEIQFDIYFKIKNVLAWIETPKCGYCSKMITAGNVKPCCTYYNQTTKCQKFSKNENSKRKKQSSTVTHNFQTKHIILCELNLKMFRLVPKTEKMQINENCSGYNHIAENLLTVILVPS